MPKIAILGRPNVGKSTLFNRLTGRKLALVDAQPGATRDWRESEANVAGLTFTIIDTAGLEEDDAGELATRMTQKSLEALDHADGVLFVIDVRAGLIPSDRHYAAEVRNSGKPVLVIANKSEGQALMNQALEAYELGLGEPIAFSAEHGEGMADLVPALEAFLEEVGAGEAEDPRQKPLKVAIVGRPNVGKSTLINKIIREERLLTGPEAGITRDSIAVDLMWHNEPVQLYDTAGLRKKARIENQIERLSALDTRRALNFAEVVVLLVDVAAPFEKQDLNIADQIYQEGRALVIGLNKWDQVPDGERKLALHELTEKFQHLFPRMAGAPIVTLSGQDGTGIGPLMRAIFALREPYARHLSTAQLNRWLREAITSHPPPRSGQHPIKIAYATQPKTKPPTIALFMTKAAEMPDSYQRYLENHLKKYFELERVPVRFILRQKANPYAKSDKPSGAKTRANKSSTARK